MKTKKAIITAVTAISLILTLAEGSSRAANDPITSAKSGNWSDSLTWIGGVVPADGDTAIIASGHTLTVNKDTTIGATTGTNHGVLIKGASPTSYGRLVVSDGVTLTLKGVNGTVYAAMKVERYGQFAPQPGSTVQVDNISDGQAGILVEGLIDARGTAQKPILFTVPTANRNWGTVQDSIPLPTYASQWQYDRYKNIAITDLTHTRISNSAGTGIGSLQDTSIVITDQTPSTILQTEVYSISAITSPGNYFVDYATGFIYFYHVYGTGTPVNPKFNISYKYLDDSSAGWRGWFIDLGASVKNDVTYNEGWFDNCIFEYMGTRVTPKPALRAGYKKTPSVEAHRNFYITNSIFRWNGVSLGFNQTMTGTADDPILIDSNQFYQCQVNTYNSQNISLNANNKAVPHDHITISNNIVHSQQFLSGSSYAGENKDGHIRIVNNTGIGVLQFWYDVTPPGTSFSDGEISGNVFDGAGTGTSWVRAFVDIRGAAGHPLLFHDNVFSHYQYMIMVNHDVSFQRNAFYYFDSAITPGVGYFGYAPNVTIQNNLFYSGRADGVSLITAPGMGVWVDNWTITNNTFVNIGSSAFKIGPGGSGYLLSTIYTNMKFANNIIYGGQYAISRTNNNVTNAGRGAAAQFDNNNYYGQTRSIYSNLNGSATFSLNSKNYNLLTSPERNIAGVELWNPSYSTNQAGRSLTLTINSPDADQTLKWGNGAKQQLVKETGSLTADATPFKMAWGTTTATTITDITKSWSTDATDANCPLMKYVKFTSGNNAGKVYAVMTNTASTLSLAPVASILPLAGDTYVIYESEVKLDDGSGGTIEAGIDPRRLPTSTNRDAEIAVYVDSSPTGNPNFVNPTGLTASSYQITDGSSCIDTGSSDNAPVNDFVNTSRPMGAGFDIGAYEYTGSDGTTYTLTVNATNGVVTKNPNQATYTPGTSVILTATPSSGYVFSSWSGDLTGSANPATIIMDSNKTVTADFVIAPPDTYTITATAGANGTISPSGAVKVNSGSDQTFTITADSGYQISDVTVDGSSAGVVGAYTFTNVTANHTISAVFTAITPSTYTLTTTAANGTITKNPNQANYNSGTTVTLTATPSSGYVFSSWSGDLTGSTNPATIVMDSDKSVTANFAVDNTDDPDNSSFNTDSSNIVTYNDIYNTFSTFSIDHFGAEKDALVYSMLGSTLTFKDSGSYIYTSENSSAVGFETNLPAKTYVEYGEMTSYGSNTNETERWFYIHLHYVNNLKVNTTYHYRLVATDERGNKITSPDMTFQTRTIPNALYVSKANLGEPPYILDRANTTYVVKEDIAALTRAFTIKATGVVLDLNGHTVTYDEGAPLVAAGATWFEYTSSPIASFGVATVYPTAGSYTNIKILNGIIKQGAQNSGGAPHQPTYGFNPIYLSVKSAEIAGITAIYAGDNVGGIVGDWTPKMAAHNNVIVDQGTVVARRDNGNRAISSAGDGTIPLHHNLIKRARQMAIDARTDAYSNEIYIDSYVTNAFALYAGSNRHDHDNRIFGTGYQVVANLMNRETKNYTFDNNLIQLYGIPNDRSSEYGTQGTQVAIRMTQYANNTDAFDNITYADNTILLKGEQGATLRGFMIMTDAYARNVIAKYNTVEVTIADDIVGIQACVVTQGTQNLAYGRSPMVYENNTFITNVRHILLGDWYGQGNNHFFRDNTFTRIDDTSFYHFIGLGYIWSASYGHRFIDSTLGEGVSLEDYSLTSSQGNQPNQSNAVYGYSLRDWSIGHSLYILAKDQDSNPIVNSTIEVNDSVGNAFWGTTDSQGKAKLDVLDYTMSDPPKSSTVQKLTRSNPYAKIAGYADVSLPTDISKNESNPYVLTFTPSGVTTYPIIATTGANGSISPSGSVDVNRGSDQTFTITPNPGYQVSDVIVDGVSIGSIVDDYTFYNVTSSSHTISVTFQVIDTSKEFTITAISTNGIVAKNPDQTTYVSGTQVTLTAIPNTGYAFSKWSGGVMSTTNPVTITMNNNKTITAHFATTTTYTITATAGANGSISPTGSVTVNSGASQTFTITPNIGYHVANVLVDGTSVGAVSSYAFSNVVSDGHTISASFAANQGVPGDVNNDGIVNVLDLIAVAKAFGTQDPRYDLNDDGNVNVVDLVIVAKNYGRTS